MYTGTTNDHLIQNHTVIAHQYRPVLTGSPLDFPQEFIDRRNKAYYVIGKF